MTGSRLQPCTTGLWEDNQEVFAADALRAIDQAIPQLLKKVQVEDAVHDAIRNCEFSVSVADPSMPDCPLIAVSEGFEKVTGYALTDVMGLNCRFLNEGCEVCPQDLEDLRRCSKTGRRFQKLLQNRRCTGEYFLNLLDLQGLIVARDTANNGDFVMYLVGIQADVTSAVEDELNVPEHHKQDLATVAKRLRKELATQLQKLALSAAGELGFGVQGTWEILPAPVWVEDAAVLLAAPEPPSAGDVKDGDYQKPVTEPAVADPLQDGDSQKPVTEPAVADPLQAKSSYHGSNRVAMIGFVSVFALAATAVCFARLRPWHSRR